MNADVQPALIIFSGLPGVGKTAVATRLAVRIGATFVRVDAIEQAMRRAGAQQIGPAGYGVAHAIARANLLPGRAVVVDCVNALAVSQAGWCETARDASARLVNLHLVCSDSAEHRRRIDMRVADLAGHVLPTWADALAQDFHEHDGEHLRLDTAGRPVDALVEAALAYVLAGQTQPD